MVRAVWALSATALLAACVSPNIPDVEPVGKIAIADDFLADARPPAGLGDLWWRGFSDEALDQLVGQALDQNQSIEAARQRLLAAQAIVQAEEADFLPQLDGSVSVGGSVSDSGATSDNASAGIGGGLTIDINGRLSAERAVALANADAAEYLLADQRRIIAAAVASQYTELKRTGARLRLLDQSTELQQQTLRIVRLRFEAGLSSNLDVRRAAADVSRTRAQRGPLQLARARAANALAVLIGEAPSAIPAISESDAIPNYAKGPDIGVPADLLRNRPDLLLAEADIAAAAARVGVERADLLPALSLPGLVTLGDGSVDGLFAQAIANLTAALDIPLFDGGRRDAEVDAAERELQAQIAIYRQTLLEVLSETENALVAIDSSRNRQDELANAVTESEAAFEQSNALYREGLASLFDVLDVQRQLIGSREALIDGEASLAQAYITLFGAVGSPNQTPD